MDRTSPPVQPAQVPNSKNPFNLIQSLTALSALSSSLSKSIPSLTPHTETARVQISTLWTTAKPWSEFFNTSKITPPASPSELQERLIDNVTYFSSNYIVCFLALSCASVLIHPLSFLCVLLLAALYVFLFLQNAEFVSIGPLRLAANGRLALFAVVSFVLLYATNAIGIIGSWALFGVIVSLIHAACRTSAKEPDFDSPVNSV